jgi:uncharacterized membrane protein YozB (DUF420 family)
MPPLVMIHVAAGGVGIVSGFVALLVAKGGPMHRQAGTVFLVSMLTMAGLAAVLAALCGQKLNTIAGTFTAYLVTTAWTTVRRGETSRRIDLAAMLVAFAVAAAGFMLGGFAAASPFGLEDADPSSGREPGLYFAFAILGTLAGALDLRALRRGGTNGAARLARHLWRMCLALFIAAGSFFFGQADEIPQALRGPHLMIPPLAALALMAFWLVRVRLPNSRRTAPSAP